MTVIDKGFPSLTDLGHHSARHATQESEAMGALCNAFERSRLTLAQRLQNFSLYTRRQDVARFLAKCEIFKLALDVNGSAIECGVFAGGD